MLGSRLLVSAILIPAFAGLCILDHRLGEEAWILLGVCIALTVRCCYEMCDLLRVRNLSPQWWITSVCSGTLVACLWWGRLSGQNLPGCESLLALAKPMFAFGMMVLGLFCWEAARFQSPGNSLENLGAHLLIIVYSGLLLTLTAQLRWVAGPEAGYFTLASLIICVKLGDVGAYTFGKLWGKKKMSPILSPGKTWMGALGAIVGSVLGAVLWLQFGITLFSSEWAAPAMHWCLAYGIILAMAGMVGDLSESLIKRDAGQKDAAKLMPGFGGLLDLLDSILFAGPIAYLLWMILPLATWLSE
ncbi:MAG: CDP-archaeol synthase [Planctomycetaceae bacterium]|nr:CDP-archaeol synthase [Planctomycetaceae bacterium]